MRYSALTSAQVGGPWPDGWWVLIDSEKPGWVLFAADEWEIKRLAENMNRKEKKSDE